MSSGAGEGYIGKSFNFRHSGRVVTVQSVLGEGGFSLVFLVTTPSNQRYALKRMCVNNEHDLESCRREIAIVKSTYNGHKNAVKYVDSMETVQKQGIYEILLLMQYCSGGPLVDIMNKHIETGFSEEMCLRIFCDVCEAIAKLHLRRIPIIHRDIKVENVLLSDSGDYQLCDFGSTTLKEVKPLVEGVGKVQEELDRYTTLAYRSPEMVDVYSGLAITSKADIWALGCLLYKLCFFTNPFGESILGIQSGSFSFPETSRYSMGVHSLIAYMLEPNPVKRPNICQVAHVAFKLRGRQSPIPNVFKIPLPEKLPPVPREVKPKRQSDKRGQGTTSLTATSLTPRQRPRAGFGGHSQQVADNIAIPPSPNMVRRAAQPAQKQQQHQQQQHQHTPRPKHPSYPVMPNNAPVSARREIQPDQPTATTMASIPHTHHRPQKNLPGHQPVNRSVPVINHPKVADSFGSTPFQDVCETDAFGAKPFSNAIQNVEETVDSFGSVPFNPVVSSVHRSEAVPDSPVTDVFGATPFTLDINGGQKPSQRSSISSSSSITSGKGGMKLPIRSVSESPHHSLSGSPLSSPLEETGFYLPLNNEPDRPRTAPQSPVHGTSPMPSDTATIPAPTLPKSASCVAVINQGHPSSNSQQVFQSFGELVTPDSPSAADDKGITMDEFGSVPFNPVVPEAALDPFGFEPFTGQQRSRLGSRSKHNTRSAGSLEDLSMVIGNPSANVGVPGARTGGSSVSSHLLPTQGELKKAKSHDLLVGTPV